jgi:hypothetical protein
MRTFRHPISPVLGLVILGLLTVPAQGGVVALPNSFDPIKGGLDTFNMENMGVPAQGYTNFGSWMVMIGFTDLASTGPGQGMHVNMHPLNWIATKTHFTLTPGQYEVSFDAGHAEGVDTLRLAVGVGNSFHEIIEVPNPDSGFVRVTRQFSVSALATDQDLNIDNNTAAIVPIDNVRFGPVELVPEPSLLLLFGMTTLGLAGYGWFRRRRVA